jgi:acetyltransferase-like isoleucine patch superfamily enzyme
MWGGGGIEIGENVLIAAHVAITSQTHDTGAPLYKYSSVAKKVCIEDNVWIGTHAVILPGIRIGRNAIIGAGTVVTKNVPANDIVIGIPARTIGTNRKISRSDNVGNLMTVSQLSNEKQ